MIQRTSSLNDSGAARRVQTEDQIRAILNSRASYKELFECVKVAKKLSLWSLRRMAAERIVDGLNVVGRPSSADIEFAVKNILYCIFAEAQDLKSLDKYAHDCTNYLSSFEKRYPNLGEITKRLGDEFRPLINKLLILLTDDDAQSLVRISSILRQLERSDLAEISSQQALMQEKHNTAAMTTLGAALTDLGIFDQAISYLNEALRLKPKSVHALLAMSRCQQEMGRSGDSLHFAKQAFELQPESQAAARRLISAAVASKDSEAYEDAKSVILENPKSSIKDERWLLVLIGLVLCDLGDFLRASKIYDQIAESKPSGNVGRKLSQLKQRIDSAISSSFEV